MRGLEKSIFSQFGVKSWSLGITVILVWKWGIFGMGTWNGV